MEDDVNFYDPENEDIVIRPTKGVAAYLSDVGYLVIRQDGEDGDSQILINPEHIEQFAVKIANLAGLGE